MSRHSLLAATDRPKSLVNRVDQMAQILNAIKTEDNVCRVVLITGYGGLGKTRILEEVLRRVGHPSMQELYGALLPQDDWSHLQDDVVVSAVVDFTDTKLHSRQYFLDQLGNTDHWNQRISFNEFEVARDRYQRLADVGAAHTLLAPAARQAEVALLSDLALASQDRRLVIPLDTTEHLAVNSSRWLLDRKLIAPRDLAFTTQQFILEQIEQGGFNGITFLIAGRNEEGEPFFTALDDAIKLAGSTCERIEAVLEPFDLIETKEYFQKIRYDWETTAPDKEVIDDEETAEEITAMLDELLTNEERLKVLWLYTGGQPVRLSLYMDILLEGRSLPGPLQDSYSQAEARIQRDGRKHVRKLIEKEFIDLLFGAAGGLRTLILQALVRAIRGLTAEQIHFIIDSAPYTQAAAWIPNSDRVDEIRLELSKMRSLSIIRAKADGRIGLQDEIYRIYAERMMSEEALLLDEKRARHLLYRKMQSWAEQQASKPRSDLQDYVREDMAGIRVEQASKILNTQMTMPSSWDLQERDKLRSKLWDMDLEHLHYALLSDPTRNFNEVYTTSTAAMIKDYNEAALNRQQAEMWSVVFNKFLRPFLDIPVRRAVQERGEEGIDVLERAVEQDAAVQAIVRLYLQKRYPEAMELSDRIDAEVAKLKADSINEFHSWNHTIAKADRGCWREFARIYSGKGVLKSIGALETMADDLVKLSEADVNKIVFLERGLAGEKGFQGHPALPRLLFLIANIYNNLGYAHVSSGDYRKAVKAYANSLKFWRKQKLNVTGALEATTRNNLSRALIEMGKRRSLRICRDGLALRIEEGDLLPIALSYNTLALIYNDLEQPQEALDNSARALAIANFVGDPRVVGLALLQVGEALRRVAAATNEARDANVTEELFREASRALEQAYEIFYGSEAKGESVRLIEAALELGSLYRDWVASARDTAPVPEAILRKRRANALRHLEYAADAAQKRNLTHLQLDAIVNTAWTHYYVGNLREALIALEKGVALVPVNVQLEQNVPPPDPSQHPAFWYKQLSKIHALRGEVNLNLFRAKVEDFAKSLQNLSRDEKQRRVHMNAELQALLRKAAIDYTLALAYAQMFAPNSVPLTTAYDSLYGYLKGLNEMEMYDFYRHENQARSDYRVSEIHLENFGDLQKFLEDCFGDHSLEPLASLSVQENGSWQ